MWGFRQVPYMPPGFEYRVSVFEKGSARTPIKNKPGFFSKEAAVAKVAELNS